jgi:cobaltochelatase CobT
LAIGIGHDVTRYYKHAVTLKDVDSLSKTMFAELALLLEQ